MKLPCSRLVLAGLSTLILAGCGSGDGYSLGRVRGKVTFKGQPASSGFIIFRPDDSKQTVGPQAMSRIAEDGSYTLSAEDPDDGVVVGFNRVGIMVTDPKPIVEVDEDQTPKELMTAKGQQARKPRPRYKGPTFTDRGGTVYRVLTPENLRSPETSGVSVEVGGWSNTIDFDITEDGKVDVAAK